VHDESRKRQIQEDTIDNEVARRVHRAARGWEDGTRGVRSFTRAKHSTRILDCPGDHAKWNEEEKSERKEDGQQVRGVGAKVRFGRRMNGRHMTRRHAASVTMPRYFDAEVRSEATRLRALHRRSLPKLSLKVQSRDHSRFQTRTTRGWGNRGWGEQLHPVIVK
jgi:hypothetical protein